MTTQNKKTVKKSGRCRSRTAKDGRDRFRMESAIARPARKLPTSPAIRINCFMRYMSSIIAFFPYFAILPGMRIKTTHDCTLGARINQEHRSTEALKHRSTEAPEH